MGVIFFTAIVLTILWNGSDDNDVMDDNDVVDKLTL